MKKIYIFSLLGAFIFINKSFSQVTIGSGNPPNDFSILEVDASQTHGGLRLPQLSTADRNTLTTSASLTSRPLASGLVIYNTTTNQTEYWDGTEWVASSVAFTALDGLEKPTNNTIGIVDQMRFIYTPSISLNVSSIQSGLTINIYNEYVKQFSGTGTTALVKNTNTEKPTIPVYPGANYFDYFITGYDPSVFSNLSISDDGTLTYDVIGTASAFSYMNIIMVLRKVPR